ncbi:MAG: molybdopterin molybdenumtransferase MoeA, partial [Candidatus Zixiibacteriota bacterium]
VRIMTGAVVPDIYDAVIPVEDVTCDGQTVTITRPVKPGQHIRLPGEDLSRGDRVLPKGTVVSRLAIGVIASLGMEQLPVIRKPNVRIINTGDELVAPGQPLKAGQLYDANGPTVQSLIAPFCGSLERRPRAADDLDRLTQELQADCDVIITTGGVSAGEKDFVPEAARRSGWQEVFHKVAIKPGKPVFCAVKDNQLLLGLPGNPLSTAVTCAVFVIPALKKMMGRSDFLPDLRDAELTGEPLKSNRTVIWPGKICGWDGHTTATIAAKRSSAALSALLDSDGLIFQHLCETYQLPRVQVWPWPRILT